jgi:pyruvate/2-oxoglutarate dehydrogenase complex dihydrolipoamide acyltransferase (E2) component
MSKDDRCSVVPFPRERQLVIDSARLGKRKHSIHGLVEADVTRVRRFLREHKALTGERLSFTAYILFCLGRAVTENKAVHAYRNWRGQLVLFDDVDVTTIVEVELDEQLFPLAHIIRSTNTRSFRDIHDEIRRVQKTPAQSPSGQRWRSARYLALLPSFLRIFFYRILLRFPHQVKQTIGTVLVTAVGMFGKRGGWGIPLPLHTLAVTIGGIAEKPGVIDGKIEIREYLSLTVSFDHDLVDGAPAARFTNRFVQLVESGEGLEK